jgi:hypothetical protein
MKSLLLGLAIATVPMTGGDSLWCDPVVDPGGGVVVEFQCGAKVDSWSGAIGRRLCPPGYAHIPTDRWTCRLKSKPMKKVVPKLGPMMDRQQPFWLRGGS